MVIAPERSDVPAAGGDREQLERARSILIERLRRRSDDFEATQALQRVERALQEAPDPDGPWRWAHRVRSRPARRR